MSLVHQAAKAWDVENESLDSVNLRIHDGAPVSELETRADNYVARMFATFDYLELTGHRLLEIGSGTGFIMEAMERYARGIFPHLEVTGLDISKSMVEKAQKRLGSGPSPLRRHRRWPQSEQLRFHLQRRFDAAYPEAICL
jgi:cyclopropane fatty-acyl-phospholipid synthase-like methyltransferase